jgi:lipoprotein-anchoring transpeptidase ErfK/SrfK
VIDRQQLAEALAGLDPRDREVLDYSLRRRVPDQDLAALFQTSAAEVARMRATSVEALSAALGVERGADLGHMLKELLDESTWELVDSAAPSETMAPAAPSQQDAPPEPAESGHRPLGASGNPPHGPPRAEPGEPAAEGDRAPVLGMLGADDQPANQPRRRGRRRALVAAAAAVGVLVPAALVFALTSDGDDAGASGKVAPGTDGTRPFKPKTSGAAEPFPSDPQSANEYPIAYVRGKTKLYDAPNGKVKVTIPGKTDWDSPRVLGVAARRGQWLAVLVPELKNGQRAWIREDKVTRLNTVPYSINVDLSRRSITVEKNGKVQRKARIGVGRVNHSTPTGHFSVTDKLRVSDPGSPYGCCVLALTGHQTRLPAGWPGGDRLAIHATHDLSGLGKAVSLGCMRADPRDARWMMETVPLGTPVFIRQ